LTQPKGQGKAFAVEIPAAIHTGCIQIGSELQGKSEVSFSHRFDLDFVGTAQYFFSSLLFCGKQKKKVRCSSPQLCDFGSRACAVW